MLVKDLQRKEYINIMKETNFGWNSSGAYKNIGCPTDIPFIFAKDMPHPRNCIMGCKECWNYVLKNKWGSE